MWMPVAPLTDKYRSSSLNSIWPTNKGTGASNATTVSPVSGKNNCGWFKLYLDATRLPSCDHAKPPTDPSSSSRSRFTTGSQVFTSQVQRLVSHAATSVFPSGLNSILAVPHFGARSLIKSPLTASQTLMPVRLRSQCQDPDAGGVSYDFMRFRRQVSAWPNRQQSFACDHQLLILIVPFINDSVKRRFHFLPRAIHLKSGVF